MIRTFYRRYRLSESRSVWMTLMDETSDPDIDSFFKGEADDFPEFSPVTAVLHREPGNLLQGWYDLGESGARLIRFAHRFGSYDWNDDPNHDEQMRSLERYNFGEPSEPIHESFDLLWRCLFAAVRQVRISHQSDQSFRSNPITHFAGIRSPLWRG